MPDRPWSIDGVGAFFGFRYEGPGVLRLDIRDELINPAGLLSGVACFALVDYAMGSALWQQTTDDEGIATLNVAINFVATAREGCVTCHAHVDRRNKTSAVLRAQVTAGDERLLGTAVGSYSIYPRRRDHGGGGRELQADL
ncbi:PaaI family thioesterase [Conexibacter sp. SYSU D00693]|uniref:PaaI family thioesterase n=1 Tax=Conexibacter sp. SYSU D00693 TaxID=2812560 RepID=UPI00196B4BF0|nr:PaaI family thioesterase [Conexibacter sp. SYSU D00693]